MIYIMGTNLRDVTQIIPDMEYIFIGPGPSIPNVVRINTFKRPFAGLARRIQAIPVTTPGIPMGANRSMKRMRRNGTLVRSKNHANAVVRTRQIPTVPRVYHTVFRSS